MKATPKQQGQLLQLQQKDLRATRLDHLMQTHPIRLKLVELKGRSDDLQRFVVGLGTELMDKREVIAKMEGEIEKVRSRGQVQQSRLDSGKVGIRDMSAVQHEIGRIKVRQDDLEAELLEQMESLEASEAKLADAEVQVGVLAKDEAATEAELQVALVDPTAEMAQLVADRQALREDLPTEVVAEYDRLRERQGPVVVLHLDGGSLMNSPVMVSADELDQAQAAPADELWISDETGFLVARPEG